MSAKGRGLTYEKQEPAFLRKLREGHLGGDADRHERQIARPKRAKVEDEEDDPTYVIEESNDMLSKAEYEALLAGKEDPNVGNSTADETDAAKQTEESVAKELNEKAGGKGVIEAGKLQKKRKAVKIVGADGEQEEEQPNPPPKKPSKLKKKAKTMVLSFGDEEEG